MPMLPRVLLVNRPTKSINNLSIIAVTGLGEWNTTLESCECWLADTVHNDEHN